MVNTSRFEIKLPAERRAQLDALASETGLSTSAVVRLAIVALLDRRTVVLPGAPERPA